MSGKLKEVRLRIASVKNTQQITKAMKLVAAAKLRKAQEAITEMRPYSESLSNILRNIMSGSSELDIKLNEVREVNKALIVVVSSDKGLCGGFNSNLIKKAKSLIEGKYKDIYEAGDLSIMFIGKKANDVLKIYDKAHMNKNFMDLFSKLTFEKSAEAADYVIDAFVKGHYDEVSVCYAEFVNAAVQNYKIDQLLPVAEVEDEETTKSDFIFEPNKQEIVDALIPKILKTQFFKYLLENNASEQGARMTAMEQATENAEELMKDLKISYNRARQAAITTELSEIVAGAASLEGA